MKTEQKKKKHEKSCPCLVFSIPYWILSVDLRLYWKAFYYYYCVFILHYIAHFFSLLVLYLYLKGALTQTNTCPIYPCFVFLLLELFICLLFFTDKHRVYSLQFFYCKNNNGLKKRTMLKYFYFSMCNVCESCLVFIVEKKEVRLNIR